MAVAVASVIAAQRDPSATVLVLAADHVVRDHPAFVGACREAIAAAAEGRIVTFGITPTFPATKYGYIRPGAALNGAAAFAVEAFVEKPDAQTAGRYITENYLWNSGNFVFRADVMQNEFVQLEPEIAKAGELAVSGMTRDSDFFRLPADAFEHVKKSFDYAVMERTSRAAVAWIAAGRISEAGAPSGT